MISLTRYFSEKLTLLLAAGLFVLSGCAGGGPHSDSAPRVTALVADKAAPQAAQSVPIVWRAEASGGVGEKVYVFELVGEDGVAQVVQRGTSPNWSWCPEEAGRYRVRVQVNDALGQQARSRWSKKFRIASPLVIGAPEPDRDGGELLIDTPVKWSVDVSGGIGEKNIVFYLEKKGNEPIQVQQSAFRKWFWKPAERGDYRVRAIATDALDNQVESAWSSPLSIVAPLAFKGLASDMPSPQRALRTLIRWTAGTTGGVGETTYEFQSVKNNVIITEHVGTDQTWAWKPRKPGKYRIRVIVRDADGNTVKSDWSPEYRIEPAITRETLLAFLPVENLSGNKVPTQEIEKAFTEDLKEQGFRLLPQEDLKIFMRKHRVRHTGGIGSQLTNLIREETGAEAVLITSVESYEEESPPKISLISRIVLCGPQPEIVWMKSTGLTGEDSPGVLGLGLVLDPNRLLENAVRELLGSLDRYIAGEEKTQRPPYIYQERKISADISLKDKYLPRQHYRATEFNPAARYVMAVVPFLNEYARQNAGFVVPLHFIENLNRYENLEVLEPGLVREQLLKYRLIMAAGPSLAVSDVLSSPTTLDADLVLSGKVFEYQGLRGDPRVDFSVEMFDGKKREVVWWSRSYTSGDEGVYFFDVGRIHAAHGLMNRMSGAVSAMMFNGEFP